MPRNLDYPLIILSDRARRLAEDLDQVREHPRLLEAQQRANVLRNKALLLAQCVLALAILTEHELEGACPR